MKLKKLYERNEIAFTLVWTALYMILMNIAQQFCGGFDKLAAKTVPQLLIPVICIIVLAPAATLWIVGSKLTEKYGLCSFTGRMKPFLFDKHRQCFADYVYFRQICPLALDKDLTRSINPFCLAEGKTPFLRLAY